MLFCGLIYLVSAVFIDKGIPAATLVSLDKRTEVKTDSTNLTIKNPEVMRKLKKQDVPHSDEGYISFIFSMVKLHLVHIPEAAENGTENRNRKSHENFTAGDCRSVLDRALNFRGLRQVTYSVEDENMGELDRNLGEQWDRVGNKTKLITSITFSKKNYFPGSPHDKLSIHVDIIPYESNRDDYRHHAKTLAQIKYRNPNTYEPNNQSTNQQSDDSQQPANQPTI